MSLIWRGVWFAVDEVTEFFWLAFRWTFVSVSILMMLYNILLAGWIIPTWGDVSGGTLDNPWLGLLLDFSRYYWTFLANDWWMWVLLPFSVGFGAGLAINVIMWLIIMKMIKGIFD